MQRFMYDVIVVGGGLIGSATAREILIRNPKIKLAIVEKENYVAAHQSGHNSGVIHSGIYYTPGSLKARLCVEGLDLTYKYCTEKNIPYKKCGKLIVALDPSEVKRLDDLYNRALQNNVKDISLLDQEGIKKLEPHVQGIKAIWSPNTGIVDWAEINRSYVEDCKAKGADVFLKFPVKRFLPHQTKGKGSYVLVCGLTTELMSKYVVTCGGLHSDTLSVLTKCSPEPKIIPFRGEYLVLKPEASHLVKTNIYPVPHPDLPFLGVHFTPRIDGSVWLGPNAVLAFKKEGYKLSDIDINELYEVVTFQGFRKLASKNLAYGFDEFFRGLSISAQVRNLQRYIPELKPSHVIRGPTGVRAQALSVDGTLVDDFILDMGKEEFDGKILHVRNAPSPAATSSLAIAKTIVDKLEEKFQIKAS